jgi:DNA-directed RNA polymerase specialized sigma24 family protein
MQGGERARRAEPRSARSDRNRSGRVRAVLSRALRGGTAVRGAPRRQPLPAADLTADIFVAAIESARTYRRRRGDPLAWLFGIDRNLVTGERRRTARNLRATARVRERELVDEEGLVTLHERIDAESAARSRLRQMAELGAQAAAARARRQSRRSGRCCRRGRRLPPQRGSNRGLRRQQERRRKVTVGISSLRDTAGLERKLREAGIHAVVQYVPPGKACKQRLSC